jgi:phosphoribosylglycinamide formyltransferase-1
VANYRLAILASGGGSNADQICRYFQSHPDIHVDIIITNRIAAGVFQVAEHHDIPCLYIPKSTWEEKDNVLKMLMERNITHIILAGFLLLIPAWLIRVFPKKIINIHPALLPKYGGKGMYGHHVHAAVHAAGDPESGITIHEVNEEYDAGSILFQKKVTLDKEDSPEDIASKVLKIEHAWYARVIEKWVKGEPLVFDQD